MKLCLLGDTHISARGDSLSMHLHFKKFYTEFFFPTLLEQGVDTIIQLGDTFDRRKYMNFNSLYMSREYLFDPLRDLGFKMHIPVGNHDCFFKSTNLVNSPSLLLKEYDNIFVYSGPEVVDFDGVSIMMTPWINSENCDETFELMKSTKAQIMCGHLEIQGFEMYRGSKSDHGLMSGVFDKFDLVFSGHYHHRSSRGNIHYVGTPYEMTWSDYGDPKGFYILDTESRELEYFENPNPIFHKIYYDDLMEIEDKDYSHLENCYVKLIVRNKTNPYQFDLFLDKVEKTNPHEVQVIEDTLQIAFEEEQDVVNEVDDTLTILRNSCSQLNTKVNKQKLDSFMTELYTEAMSLNG